MSCSDQAVVRQSPGSGQVVIRQTLSCRQAVVRQSSVSHQAVVRKSSGGRQAVVRHENPYLNVALWSSLLGVKVITDLASNSFEFLILNDL